MESFIGNISSLERKLLLVVENEFILVTSRIRYKNLLNPIYATLDEMNCSVNSTTSN